MSAANLAPDLMHELAQLRRELAALRAEAASPAAGWRLVPVEPTDEMIVAATLAEWHEKSAELNARTKAIWAAMLRKAPPSPPTTERDAGGG